MSKRQGKERTHKQVKRQEQRSVKAVDSSVSLKYYRLREKNIIVKAFQKNVSLRVLGELGCGKTTLAELVAQELKTLGYRVVLAQPSTAKQFLVDVAEQLGIETQPIQGKKLRTISMLQEAISEFLRENEAFLICDNAHRLQERIQDWLKELNEKGQAMVVLATHFPESNPFLRLPPIELKPLSTGEIREIMHNTAAELAIEFTDAEMSEIQEWCGGNPMLAKKAVYSYYLGIEQTCPEHAQFIDGTPFLIIALSLFVIVGLFGSAFNSTNMHLFGGILTVVVSALRLLFYSLPRKSKRLGQ